MTISDLWRNVAFLLVHPATPDDVNAEIIEMSLRVGASTYIKQNCAMLIHGDLRAVLPGIGVPIAVIVGREDVLLPVEMSEEIHRLTPVSTLHCKSDRGHLPPIEKPDAVADLLRKLILQG